MGLRSPHFVLTERISNDMNIQARPVIFQDGGRSPVTGEERNGGPGGKEIKQCFETLSHIVIQDRYINRNKKFGSSLLQRSEQCYCQSNLQLPQTHLFCVCVCIFARIKMKSLKCLLQRLVCTPSPSTFHLFYSRSILIGICNFQFGIPLGS